jgi:hypothetical protein
MYISFSSTLSEKDMQKTFKSEKYSDMLSNIPLMLGEQELGKIKINSLNTKIKGSKLVISSEIGCEMGFLKYKFPVGFESGIEANNNSIYLVNFKLQPSMFGSDLAFLSDFTQINRIKLVDLNTAKTDPYRITIFSINIKNSKIATDGTVFIPANTVLQ